MLTYDLMQPENETALQIMQKMAQQTGLSLRQSENMLARLQQDFALISTEDFKGLLTKVGFKHCKTYCQIMNYYGFFLKK